ncbi:MAG: calcium/sodium antiporter [Defluviitaleaceae bacterium]|nr:calcium/sodium antiporter [Defluviitaleaceae bacterium]
MLVQIILLILGFILLIKGADIFVNSCVGIAKKLKIPSFIIALTIVAMGTSAPEFVITVTASINGHNALALGNIVGANIFNLMFIIGLCAIIKTIPVKVNEVSKDFLLSIAAAAFLLALKFLGGDYIPRFGSLILVVAFGVYLFLLIRKAIKAKDGNAIDEADSSDALDSSSSAPKLRPMPLLILFAVFGCALIIAGGHLTVESATQIATTMGISERVIGLTVIAIGTSLPELIISLVACKKGENEFALGNIIGSNIFNIMFVLGVAGLISPLAIEGGLIFDTIFLVVGSIIALIFVYSRKRITRIEGIIMVALYLGYMAFAIFQ